MRKPARSSSPPNKARVVRSAKVAAPVGGLNARDALADMPATDAVVLDNWFPRTGDVHLRGGYSEWVTGFSNPIESLMEYSAGDTYKLFAAAGDSIFDVTTTGTLGAADITGLSNARWQHINFATSGGQFLFIVNGEDDPRYYDGSTWTTPSITGFTASTAIHVNAHKKRIWMIEDDTMNAYYLGTSSISGAASQFPLGAQATLGGHLLAMATWTIDGGDGTDDLAVFITTEGEVIVYKGTDPATDFALVGVFRIPRPIGYRCFVKYGGDLVIVTNAGVYPLSKALITSRATPKVAISDKIEGLVNSYAIRYQNKFGWQPILYPKGPFLLINVPTSELSASDQLVMNTTTNAWCRFKDIAAFCWALSGDDLYFGGATAVYIYDEGTSDMNTAIAGDVQTAFSEFGAPSMRKHFTLCKPIFAAGGTVTPSLIVNVDFGNTAPNTPALSAGAGGTPWGSPWGSPWSSTGYAIRDDWQTCGTIGTYGAARVKVMTKTQEISLMSFDYVFETGGFL